MKGIEQFVQVDAATLGALKYAGTWNASTNTPTLASGVGVQGQYYVVSVAGTTNLDGETNWQVGDWAVFNGSVWQKVDGGSTGLLTTLTVTGNTFLATTSGDVGIGTTSPANKLHVTGTGSTPTLFERTGSNGVYLQLKDASGASVFLGADNGLFAVQTPGSSYSNKLVVDSSGNVGIGTSSPLQQLHLSSASATGMQITYQGVGASRIGVAAGNLLTFGLDTSNGATTRMTIDSSGNLGLGVTPTSKLQIDTTSASTASITTVTSFGAAGVVSLGKIANNSEGVYLGSGTVETGINGGIAAGIGFLREALNWNSALAFYTNNVTDGVTTNRITERMRIDASGNLSIGQTSSALQSGGTGITLYGSSASEIKFLNSTTGSSATDGTALVTSGSDFVINNRESGAVTFGTSNTERARIDASGNLLVGTTANTESAKLNVQGGYIFLKETNGGDVYLRSGFGAGTDPAIQVASNDPLLFVTNNTERMRIDSAGNVGIGVTPSAWSTNRRALQIGGGDVAALGLAAQYSEIAHNTISTVSGPQYATSNPAAVVDFNNAAAGGFAWRIAPSGTAGNAISFTQAMTLDASGNLLVGGTSPVLSTANRGNITITGSASSIVSVGTSASAYTYLYHDASGAEVWNNQNTYLRFGTNNTERARIPAAGGMVVGTAAIATNATDGFLYVPTCAGTPTGTPTTQTGTAPIVIDTTNNKLYFYSGGQWRDAGP